MRLGLLRDTTRSRIISLSKALPNFVIRIMRKGVSYSAIESGASILKMRLFHAIGTLLSARALYSHAIPLARPHMTVSGAGPQYGLLHGASPESAASRLFFVAASIFTPSPRPSVGY